MKTIHSSPARHPSQYYVRRLQQGVRAYRSGVRDTPLTRTLERWMDHQIIVEVGNQEVPGALDTYARVFWEYVDAIDAEDELVPFRFQLVGEMWVIHFTIEGMVKITHFADHKGFRYLARLLESPHRSIGSLDLAKLTDPRTLAIIQEERRQSTIQRHDDKSMADYKAALAVLKEKRIAAQYKGDDKENGRLCDRIDQLEAFLLPGKRKGIAPNFDTLRRQQEGKSKTELLIHKAVGTEIRRAKKKLKTKGMGELADFLDRNVNPEGKGSDYAYAYRPSVPATDWTL